jgi:hypothetical protein
LQMGRPQTSSAMVRCLKPTVLNCLEYGHESHPVNGIKSGWLYLPFDAKIIRNRQCMDEVSDG